MQCSEVAIGDGSVVFDVRGAFFPICSVEEFYSGKFYSCTAASMRFITFQSMTDMAGVTGKHEKAAGDSGNSGSTIDAIDAFVQTRQCCRNCSNQNAARPSLPEKKLAKDLFLQLLRYTSLFAPRTKNCSSELETKRCRDWKEAYENLYKQHGCGMRDTTWWRMTRRKEIRAERYFACGLEDKNVFPRDHYFGSDTAKKLFIKFQKFSNPSADETSFCLLYRFDAVITHALDCFVDIIKDASVPIRTHQMDHSTIFNVANAVTPRKKSNQGGTIPQDSARNLRRLLPVAVKNFMSSCFEIFKKRTVASGVDGKNDFSFVPAAAEIDRLQNKKRKLSATFKKAFNGNSYIAFAAHAFKDCVCE